MDLLTFVLHLLFVCSAFERTFAEGVPREEHGCCEVTYIVIIPVTVSEGELNSAVASSASLASVSSPLTSINGAQRSSEGSPSFLGSPSGPASSYLPSPAPCSSTVQISESESISSSSEGSPSFLGSPSGPASSYLPSPAPFSSTVQISESESISSSSEGSPSFLGFPSGPASSYLPSPAPSSSIVQISELESTSCSSESTLQGGSRISSSTSLSAESNSKFKASAISSTSETNNASPSKSIESNGSLPNSSTSLPYHISSALNFQPTPNATTSSGSGNTVQTTINSTSSTISLSSTSATLISAISNSISTSTAPISSGVVNATTSQSSSATGYQPSLPTSYSNCFFDPTNSSSTFTLFHFGIGISFINSNGSAVLTSNPSISDVPPYTFAAVVGGPSGVYDIVAEDGLFVAIYDDGHVGFTPSSSQGQTPIADSIGNLYVTTIWSISCDGNLTAGIVDGYQITFGLIGTSNNALQAAISPDSLQKRQIPAFLATAAAIVQPIALGILEIAALLNVLALSSYLGYDPPRCGSGDPPSPVEAWGARAPSYNGCGSGLFVWNTVHPFEPCCNGHDLCYDNCAQTYTNCNNVFASCMITKCQSTYPGDTPSSELAQIGCLTLGSTFATIVEGGIGIGVFYSANHDRCTCCATGLVSCPNGCVTPSAYENKLTDPNDCGDCGVACAFGQTCSNGKCLECKSPLQACGDSGCVDFTSDPENCGDCDNSCPSGLCLNSACVDCPADQTVCDDSCVDTFTDDQNCGDCGTVCATGTCQNGVCLECAANEDACLFECVDLSTDAENCGTCQTVCDSGLCEDGVCSTACPSGWILCSSDPALHNEFDFFCTDISSDPDHCGDCDTVCESGVCEDGVCTNPTMTCASGLTLCDNDECVDLLTDPSNCGACNSFCDECAGGICCGLGLEACGEFCVNAEVDLNNCGSCGNICPSPDNYCQSGICNYCDLNAGYGFCINAINITYCYDFQNDWTNCGSCGYDCISETGFGNCVGGECAFCPAGIATCTDDLGELYCRNLSSSSADCGSCGHDCGFDITCVDGVCQ